MYELRGFRVTRGRLLSGDRGTHQTLAIMRRLALEGAAQLEVRESAIGIVHGAAAPHHPIQELGALYRWVRDQIRFTSDPVGIEHLQSPRYTLHVRAGDCDDRATLLAALARSIGLAADLRFRAIGADPMIPGRFSHVYVVATLRDGRRIALDPTYPDTPLGWEHPRPTRTLEVPA